MFGCVLVANRGEIAIRVLRAARALGLETVAVYSDADRAAPHVREADTALRIGPAPAAESYLSIPAVIDAARRAGAEAVHPGYGFLSENEEFAQACADAGLVFIGPPPSAIKAMGLKAESKQLMEKAGVPLVPGYHGSDQDPALLQREADRIGYPVLIKASAGGLALQQCRVLVMAVVAGHQRHAGLFHQPVSYTHLTLPTNREV